MARTILEPAPTVARARELGQSLWQDELDRPTILSGRLAELVQLGISGVTTNPTIFGKALAGSDAYEMAIQHAASEHSNPQKLLWELVIADVQLAADVLRTVFNEQEGADGFVSIEVDPALADDSERTLAMVRDLWQRCDRPNVFVKIPATKAGLPAIRQALAEGINVNVTLIFSVSRYREVVDAFMRGLEDRLEKGQDISRLASVASFFVSRMDTKVDKRLDEMGEKALRGKAAIANSKLAYETWAELHRGPRWERLAQAGARRQRCLWASTSTKDPSYPDTKYVDALIGPETVNTMPHKTFLAFAGHGVAERTLDRGLEEAHRVVEDLKARGIDLDQVGEELEREGVKLFADSWHAAGGLLGGELASAAYIGSELSFPASDPPTTSPGSI